ncbi:MAG: hypothetical protein ACYC5Q_06715 [Thermoleophilia bacterium]
MPGRGRGRPDLAESAWTFLGSALRSARYVRPLRVPGVPGVPRLLALAALRHPSLVPYALRWKAASRGLGLVVAGLVDGEDDPSWAGATMGVGARLQAIGEEQGRALNAQLGYGRGPVECARAVALANRLYDIRAAVAVSGPDEARVVTPGCPWSREPWWGPTPCGAFSRYELGLVAGLNPAVRLRYECKKTRGDDRCVGVYTWKEPRADRPAHRPGESGF